MLESPVRPPATVRGPGVRPVVSVLGALSVVFFATTLAACALRVNGRDPGLLGRLDASLEGNLPTWFSSVMLLTAGALAISIGLARRAGAQAWSAQWLVFGLLFVAASADEVGQVHELAVGPVMDAVRAVGLDGNAGRGVAAALALVAAGALLAAGVPWVRDLPAPTRKALVLAAAVYFGGALGVEIAERLVATAGGGSGVEELLKAPEELMEMIGAVTFIAALLPLAPDVTWRR